LSQAIPKVSDLPVRIQAEIEERLDELRPALEEYERLIAAAAALDQEAAARRGRGRRGSPAGPPAGVTPGRGRGRGGRGSAAAGVSERMASTAATAENPGEILVVEATPKRERAQRGAAAEAIVAALEHGSHTVSELMVVTAMAGPNIRGNLRRLLKERTITQTKRAGKTAYALAS
jgi:hypothetical protein